MRLRLTTSRPAGYRRGGQVLAGNDAPVIVTRDSLSLAQGLALLEDPNVAIAFSEDDEGDTFEPLSAEMRADGIAATKSLLEAEKAKVDPNDPPTPDAAETKLHDLDGAKDKPEGAAASDGAAEAKVAEDKVAAAVDPAQAEGAAAANSEQSRETADAAASDRKVAAEEGKQPEATSRPPVAATASSGSSSGRKPKSKT